MGFSLAAIVPAAMAAMAGEKDCAAPACPDISLAGDREFTLPNGEPGPFRGFADPTVRRDPVTGRLWMAYSWPSVRIDADRRLGPFRRQGGSPQA
jgi:hypothetical protein